MGEEYIQIATATAAALAPFMPFLVEGLKSAFSGFGDSAGKAAYENAVAIWNKIKSKSGDDSKLDRIALVLAADPKDEDAKGMLAKAVSIHLKDDPALMKFISDLLGGKEAVQNLVIENNSWAEKIKQEITGSGSQTMNINGSVVISAEQSITNPK